MFERQGAWEGSTLPKTAPPAETKFVATVIEVLAAVLLTTTVLGLKEQADAGIVWLQVNVTLSLNPLVGTTVMTNVTGVPAFVLTLPGLAVRLMPGGVACADPKFAIRQKRTPTSHDTIKRRLIDIINFLLKETKI
ncbi:MAG: hypothetical protein DMG67_15120 [Acidobacteria bacterium]|nr:MAG: hypothetical protein DMG67_15120 [Acidobacteriota bacterium]